MGSMIHFFAFVVGLVFGILAFAFKLVFGILNLGAKATDRVANASVKEFVDIANYEQGSSLRNNDTIKNSNSTTSDKVECSDCSGSGVYLDHRGDDDEASCPYCGGSGYYYKKAS